MRGGELEPEPCGQLGPQFGLSQYGVAAHEIPPRGGMRIRQRHIPYKPKASGCGLLDKGQEDDGAGAQHPYDLSSCGRPEYESA